MRISDWSSDVCSSDLGSESLRKPVQAIQSTNRLRPGCNAPHAPIRNDTRATGRGRGGRPRLGSLESEGMESGTADHRAGGRCQEGLLTIHGSRLLPCHGWRRRPCRDRKSVVKGKRVSVRVELGGRGGVTKKKK